MSVNGDILESMQSKGGHVNEEQVNIFGVIGRKGKLEEQFRGNRRNRNSTSAQETGYKSVYSEMCTP